MKYYGSRNESPEDEYHSPGFGVEAARWLIQNRKIRGIGTDAGSLEIGSAGGLTETGGLLDMGITFSYH